MMQETSGKFTQKFSRQERKDFRISKNNKKNILEYSMPKPLSDKI